MLTADDVKILETAEWLEGRQRVNREAAILARTGLSATRYTQQLLHLVIRHDVIRDPKWTGLAYRIQDAAHGAVIRRQARTLGKAS